MPRLRQIHLDGVCRCLFNPTDAAACQRMILGFNVNVVQAGGLVSVITRHRKPNFSRMQINEVTETSTEDDLRLLTRTVEKSNNGEGSTCIVSHYRSAHRFRLFGTLWFFHVN